MSIQSEITRIQKAKSDIISAVRERGIVVPDDANIEDLAPLIKMIRAQIVPAGYLGELYAGEV